MAESRIGTEQTLSPQEIRLHTGTGYENRRAGKILAGFQGSRPVIDIERGKYFTESFRQTEGQPLILRWAKALYDYAEHASVYVDDGQLIAGRAGRSGRYGILYPELDGDYLDEAIQSLPERGSSPFDITPEDAEYIIREIAPYWKGKTFHEALAAAIPAETRRYTYNDEAGLESRFIVNETASFRSSIQWVHDYEKPLKIGFLGIKREAEERLAALDPFSPVDQTEKKPFLEAVILAQTGVHFVDYVNTVKLKRAAWLLINTKLGIAEIARRLDYRDNSYFSKLFRAKYGVPPSIFRLPLSYDFQI